MLMLDGSSLQRLLRTQHPGFEIPNLLDSLMLVMELVQYGLGLHPFAHLLIISNNKISQIKINNFTLIFFSIFGSSDDAIC